MSQSSHHLKHDNEFTALQWPPQSPDLSPIEHLWDVLEREILIMDVQPTNLQQLCSTKSLLVRCVYASKATLTKSSRDLLSSDS